MLIIYNSIIRIISNNKDNDYFNPENTIIEDTSIGTGFFIAPNIIITCSHVVENAKVIYYTIPSISNIKYKAIIRAICDDLDIAILESTKYHSEYTLSLNNSDLINIQDNIKVIGFPLGKDKIKVTKGIISGLQDGLIQIDSAINSGNSGGPLLNQDNNIIGIISAKIENAENVGFAIPINLLQIFKLIDSSKSISILNSCNLLANFSNTSTCRINMINKRSGLNIDTGYTVIELSNNSPLKKINFDVGDLILEFNNKKINNFGELQTDSFRCDLMDYVTKLIPNNFYNIKFYSFRENKIIDVKLIFDVNNLYGIKKLIPAIDKLDYLKLGGLILTPLTLNILEKKSTTSSKLRKLLLSINTFEPKIIIANILPDSPFNLSENFSNGDIIKSINNIIINTIDQLKNFLLNLSINEHFLTIETINKKIDTISIDLIKNDIDLIK